MPVAIEPSKKETKLTQRSAAPFKKREGAARINRHDPLTFELQYSTETVQYVPATHWAQEGLATERKIHETQDQARPH